MIHQYNDLFQITRELYVTAPSLDLEVNAERLTTIPAIETIALPCASVRSYVDREELNAVTISNESVRSPEIIRPAILSWPMKEDATNRTTSNSFGVREAMQDLLHEAPHACSSPTRHEHEL